MNLRNGEEPGAENGRTNRLVNWLAAMVIAAIGWIFIEVIGLGQEFAALNANLKTVSERLEHHSDTCNGEVLRREIDRLEGFMRSGRLPKEW